MSENNQTKNQKEIGVIFQKPWRIFIIEFSLFFLSLGLGIITAFKANKILEIQKISPPQISFWNFFIYFLLTTLLFLLIIRFLKFKKGKRIIFKIIFVLAVFWGGLIFLEVWLPNLVSLIILFILILWWLKNPLVLNQNILMILGMVGVGSILGLAFQPLIVVAFLIIFSIYDFIAVYKTKHMIKIAEEMIENRVILGLVIPSRIFDFQENLEKIKPGGDFLILGGGDIVFPLILCVSLVPSGILNTLVVAIFVLIGLFFSFYIFINQKIRRPIPALPPIALFSIIGFLISLII